MIKKYMSIKEKNRKYRGDIGIPIVEPSKVPFYHFATVVFGLILFQGFPPIVTLLYIHILFNAIL